MSDCGNHLGAVRNWIKWNCHNGSHVTWGSTDLLEHEFTVLDLEEIAGKVRDAVGVQLAKVEAERDDLRTIRDTLQGEVERLRDCRAEWRTAALMYGTAQTKAIEAARKLDRGEG